MNRGSPMGAQCDAPARLGFNEAPIHESGKFRERISSSRVAAGFNEAPIHESGKSDSRKLLGSRQLLASMRPRFMNRGSSAIGSVLSLKVQLQ